MSKNEGQRALLVLLLIYGAASLVHFTHNAEFVADYPNLPASWAVYAALGLDSLGHYVLAPLSAHTLAMNSTILIEVTAAALVLVEVSRQHVRRLFINPIIRSRGANTTL